MDELKLTRKEALEQGYEKCGRSDQQWQSLTDISDMADDDFDRYKWLVADKEAKHPSISSEQLSDLISDHVSVNHSDETGDDDTDTVYDAVKTIDFEPTSEMINKVLAEKVSYWNLTKIELLP